MTSPDSTSSPVAPDLAAGVLSDVHRALWTVPGYKHTPGNSIADNVRDLAASLAASPVREGERERIAEALWQSWTNGMRQSGNHRGHDHWSEVDEGSKVHWRNRAAALRTESREGELLPLDARERITEYLRKHVGVNYKGYTDGILAALRTEGEKWRPIETAPLDGSAVLLWKSEEAYSARWINSEVMGPVWATPDGHVIFRASHWMPLPAPPETEGDAQSTITPAKWVGGEGRVGWAQFAAEGDACPGTLQEATHGEFPSPQLAALRPDLREDWDEGDWDDRSKKRRDNG